MTAPVLTGAEWAWRVCPLCSSERGRIILQLDASSIFAANWSYRPDQLESLGFSRDEVFPIMECTSCGFIYAGRLPDGALFEAVYDRVIDDVAARHGSFDLPGLAFRMDYLATLLRLLPANSESLSILDYGCGFGPTLRLLDRIPTVSALGYDTSSLRVDELRTRNLRVTNDLAEVGRSAPYAAVILDNVLEHLPDPRAALAQISTWCDSSALLYVGVPGASLAHMGQHQAAHGRGEPLPMDINPWEHLNYFDLEHLDALLKEFGFLPLTRSQLPGTVNIGLRPEPSRLARFKNSMASLVRLLGYARIGDASPTVNSRFYRLGGV